MPTLVSLLMDVVILVYFLFFSNPCLSGGRNSARPSAPCWHVTAVHPVQVEDVLALGKMKIKL